MLKTIDVRRTFPAFLAALFALALLPGMASAANPTIINTGTGCTGQLSWLVSCSSSGETTNSSNILRISALVSHDNANTIASLVTDDDWDGTANPANVRSVTASRPSTPSGYPRSRVNLNYTFSTTNTGMGCNPIGNHDRRTTKTARFQARDSASQTSSTSSSTINFVAAGTCLAYEDYAYVYGWGASNFDNSVVPGTSVTYTYNGDDTDSTGNSDFQGINWRYRNLRSGATTSATLSCPGGGDNSAKTLIANAPSTRGAYVLEAELRDGSGCTQDQNSGSWFPIGTVDVNSASIPAPGVAASRPQINGNSTITVTPPTDPDSAAGGGAQIIQWDLDENASNGVSGFETDSVAGEGAIFSSNQTKTVNTTGMTPGLHTVRARVIDNGAMDAADSIRRTSSTATATFLVDTQPVASGQSVSTETGAALPITLSATDADSDTLTYTIQTPPAHGTLSGLGASRTYTPDAGYAGTDSFLFKADDGFGGTSTATVSITVEPNTVIDSAPSGTINSRGGTLTFHSDATGATFECSRGVTYSPCSSPYTFADFGDGPYTISVRAIAGAVTDATPATATFTVSAQPTINFTSGPTGATNSNQPTFTYVISEPGNTLPFNTLCRVDAEAFSSCTSTSYTPHVLSDGPHTVEIQATDASIPGASSSATRSFTVDTVAPDTTIDSGPTSPTNDTTPTFTFSSNEPGSSFECRVDSDPFAVCSSSFTTAALGEGPHTFDVRAIDPAGNTDATPSSSTFTVDLTNPETTIDNGPPEGSTIGTTTPTFDFSSDDGTAAFQCSIDSGAFALCSSPYTMPVLGGGPHTFAVRAVDPAGNIDPTPAQRSFNVDLGAPETAIDSGPADGSTVATATPTFGFSADDPNATFECKVDSGAYGSCTSAFTTASLGDGPHTFSVRATDLFGNTDPTPASRSFTVDTTGPDTIIDTAPPSITNSTSATVTFHASEGSVTFECQIDGGAFSACSSSKTYTGLSDGPHTIAVRALDAVGNPDPTPATAAFTVDTVAPDTIIDSGPSGPVANATPSFTFHSTEPDSTFECRVDSGSYASCTSAFTTPALADGPHSFSVRATDAAANTGLTPATRSFTVDTTGPDTSIDTHPPAISNSSTGNFTFSSPESPVTFECKLDGGSFAACTSPKAYTGLSDSSHTVSVRALDALGNPDATPATFTWTVDTAAPDTVIDTGPSTRVGTAAASFTFHSTESGSTFECKLDSAAYAACTSPQAYTGLSDGAHTISVRATDAAGNTDPTPATRTWTVDTTGPTTTFNSGPSGRTNNASPSFGFTANETPATFECQIDSGAFSACTSPKAYTGLADGPHTVGVRATDDLANAGPVATRTFTVDTVGPTTNINTGPATLINTNSATVTFSSPSPDITSFECRIDGGAYAACTSPKTYTGLSDASHTIDVRGIDDVGNAGSPASRTFTVDTTPPDTVIDTGPTGTIAVNSASFTFHSTESPATFECKIDAGTFASCSSPKAYSSLADGSHTFSVRSIDQATNTDPTPATRTFTVDTTPPDTTIDFGPTGRTANAYPAFSFSSTEPGSTFQCSIDSGAFAACTSPNTIGRLTDGPHTFAVRATDPVGNTDPTPAGRAITVDTTGPDVTISSGPSGITASASASFAFSTPEAGASYECQLDGSAFSACTSPKPYSGLSEGPHTFRVRALDDLANPGTPDQRNFTVDTVGPETTIDTGPSGPTPSASPSFSFHASETSTFECKLDSGTYEACSSPKSYNLLSEGAHTFEVRATDSAANTDPTPATRSFTVDLTVPDTQIGIGPSGPTADNTPTWTFTSPDPTATFQCRIDSAAFAACTSPFTASSLSDGPHTFEVRAVDPATNVDPTPASRSITVDTIAPQTTIDTGVSGPTTNTSPSFSFSSPDSTATFECKLDSGTYEACTSPKSYSGLPDGPHTFSVRAADPVGNTDPTPDSRSFTVDTTPPDTQINSGPNGLTADSTPTWAFASPDNTATFQCRVDSAAFAACTSPFTPAALTDGPHSFEVRAVDPATNQDPSPASAAITVDTTAPQTTINFGPQGQTSNATPTFGFSSSEPGSSFECRVDSDAFTACTSPRQLATQAPGPHTFSVRATDPAGNTDQTPASRGFTVDTSGPATSIDTAPSGLTNDPTPTITFSSSKPGSTFECRFDSAPFAACSSPFTAATLADGPHTFEVQATDSSGNTDPTPAQASFTLDATAPQTTIGSAPSGTISTSSASVSFSSSEAGSSFECSLDGAAFAACSSPESLSGLADGPHSFKVRATDPAANTDQTPAEATFTVDTSAPAAQIDSGPSGQSADATPSFAFSSPDGSASFECRVDSDAFAACTSPFTASSLSDGPHTFEVRATDAAHNTGSAASRSFTVDTAAPDTVIDTATVTGSGASVTFSSPDNTATFECSLDSGAFSACTSPKTFAGLSVGQHTVSVRATDPAGNTDPTPATRTLTVTAAPDTTAPETTITSGPAEGSTTTDHNPSLDFTSSEAGSTFECSLNGEAFSACRPPKVLVILTDGAENFQVRATDAAGNTDATPAKVSWTVTTDKPAAIPPKIIKRKGSPKVPRGGRVVVATVRCPQGTCTLTAAPKRPRIQLLGYGGKYRARVKYSRGIREGGKVKVKLILPKAAVGLLPEARRAKVTLRLTAKSSNGTNASLKASYNLKPAKGA